MDAVTQKIHSIIEITVVEAVCFCNERANLSRKYMVIKELMGISKVPKCFLFGMMSDI
jgi:hypothetical protein